MIIEIVPVRQRRRPHVPPPESYYAFRHRYLAGLGAACPSETVAQGDKCCIPQSGWDGLDKRCIQSANNPMVVHTASGAHLKQGSAPPPGGGGGGTPCTSNCGSRTCGDDGCGGSCGACPTGQQCLGGTCVPDTSGGGGTTIPPTSAGGGGGIINVGGTDSGGGIDLTGILDSPLVWIGGGLLLVAVAYRIIRKPTATSPSVVVTK